MPDTPYKFPDMHYVRVLCEFDTDGHVIPVKIYYDEKQTFDIQRVTDIESPPGYKGKVYAVLIKGKEKKLYYQHPLWYVVPKER